MRTQEMIMRQNGYVTASEAAEAIGCDQIGSVHRMLKTGRLQGARAGKHWYVSVKSLLEAHKDAPPLIERIKALGVEPKDTPDTPAPKKAKPAANGGRRGRRTS